MSKPYLGSSRFKEFIIHPSIRTSGLNNPDERPEEFQRFSFPPKPGKAIQIPQAIPKTDKKHPEKQESICGLELGD